VLRNVHNGQFEIFNITNNQITGAALFSQVGLDWQLGGGFAVDSPSGSIAFTGRPTRAGDGGLCWVAAARPMA
jgi:hypothetical protein